VGKRHQCWLWQGYTDKAGYGTFWVDGKKVRAHRFAYELAWGPIPAGLCVMHRCDRPTCVNPNCLSVASNAENSADMTSKGRQARGTKHGRTVLTEAQVREIRTLPGTLKEIGERFGISREQVSHIKSRKRWGWLPDIDPFQSEAQVAHFDLQLLLTPCEAAKALSICERSLWTMTKTNQIPVVHIGRSVRYPLDELKQWISTQTKEPHGQHLA
jgi:excisionase family DNA binding protein